MLRLIFNLLTLLIVFNLCIAQSNKKWQVIKEDSEKIIYLDTKNISEVEDQLSVWSMFVYKVMSKTDENGRRIGKIKNQYVIYKATQKYSVVGTLTYDEIGRIIRNNSSNVGATAQLKSETKSLSANRDVNLIFEKALQFLASGSITQDVAAIESDDSDEYDSEEMNYDDQEETYQETEESSSASNLKRAVAVPTKTKNNKIVFRKVKTDEDNNEDIPVARPVGGDTPVARSVDSSSDSYNAANERSVRGVIFTDGNVFVVQKSAWREKYKAEKAVNRLKQKGQKAFITEANIPAKGGTWYRVRVGYFNSVAEAEKYVRTHR